MASLVRRASRLCYTVVSEEEVEEQGKDDEKETPPNSCLSSFVDTSRGFVASYVSIRIG